MFHRELHLLVPSGFKDIQLTGCKFTFTHEKDAMSESQLETLKESFNERKQIRFRQHKNAFQNIIPSYGHGP